MNRTINSSFNSQDLNFSPTGVLTSSSTSLGQENFSSSGSGRKFGGVFADLILGYSAIVAPAWVAGIQVEGTLSDMIFRAEGPGITSSSSTFTSFNAAGAVTGSSLSSQTSTNPNNEFAVKMHWATAAMVRLGFLVTPSTLLYGTGGATYAGFGDGFEVTSFRAWGWSAGAGVEQKLGSNWSVRVEYRYTDFQETTTSRPFSSVTTQSVVSLNPAGAVAGTSSDVNRFANQNTTSYHPELHTVRLGVVYTFN